MNTLTVVLGLIAVFWINVVWRYWIDNAAGGLISVALIIAFGATGYRATR